MQTIKYDKVIELEINKSKFIGYSFYVTNLQEVNNKLDFVKNLHPKATHVCYAYKTLEHTKCFDDGEPASTAGAPILNCITKQNLFNVLVIVVRYFGGIKLGAGGLVRAYGKTASLVLLESEVANLQLFDVYNFKISYENYNKLLESNVIVKNCKFNEKVEGQVLVLQNSQFNYDLGQFVKINSELQRKE